MRSTISFRAAGADITTGPASDGITYVPGDMVPWHFIPALIVASFIASLIGTFLTVELLHRKRLGKSFASRYETNQLPWVNKTLLT